MEELRKKLHNMISIMESERRKRLCRYCNWAKVSKSFLEEVINLDDWCILQKDSKQFCFTIIHEEGCEGQFLCSCTETVADPRIKLYYLSDLFTQMISVSHFQLWFSGNWRPKVLADIIDGLAVSSEILELFNIDEARTEYLHRRDPKHVVADDEEFDKEQSPDFQKMRDEFNTLICEYVKLAFTDPTSLPPFLLDFDECPTMRLSELLARLESK